MNGSPSQPPAPYQTPPKSSRGSCVLRGCLVLVIIAMLLGVVFGGTGLYLYRGLKPFLTSQPVAIHTFQGGEEAAAALQQKLTAFQQSLAAGQKATLALTGDDLNALVAQDPDLSKYRNRVFLSLENNQIIAELSFPYTEDPSLPADQRVYINARAVLDASYSDGDFAFLLARLEPIHGPPPSTFLLGVMKEYVNSVSLGYNRKFHDSPEQFGALPQIIAQIHTIIIQNGQIVAASVEHPKPIAVPDASPVAVPAASP